MSRLVRKGRDENSDSLCRLVHFVRALLAAGVARADSISGRLALVITVQAHWHLFECRVLARSGGVVSSGAALGMAEISRVTCPPFFGPVFLRVLRCNPL